MNTVKSDFFVASDILIKKGRDEEMKKLIFVLSVVLVALLIVWVLVRMVRMGGRT